MGCGVEGEETGGAGGSMGSIFMVGSIFKESFRRSPKEEESCLLSVVGCELVEDKSLGLLRELKSEETEGEIGWLFVTGNWSLVGGGIGVEPLDRRSPKLVFGLGSGVFSGGVDGIVGLPRHSGLISADWISF